MSHSTKRDEASAAGERVSCRDCGKPYSEFPLDVTLPDGQWRKIHPSEGGVLCAGCIVERAGKLPGVVAVRAVIEFARCEDSARPSGIAASPCMDAEKGQHMKALAGDDVRLTVGVATPPPCKRLVQMKDEAADEIARLKAELDEAKRERDGLLERADVAAWPFCERCLIRWDVRRYQLCPTCVMDAANDRLTTLLARAGERLRSHHTHVLRDGSWTWGCGDPKCATNQLLREIDEVTK